APFKAPPKGPPPPARPLHAHRQAPRPPGIPQEEGRGAIPSPDGQARNPQVTAASDRSRTSTARTSRAHTTLATLTPESAQAPLAAVFVPAADALMAVPTPYGWRKTSS